jgi:AcrR family transcriptional regulator
MEAARPLRADAERNRRRILEAAVEVIGRRGLDAPVEEIARVAGVGRGTLYRRFPTKDELVRSIILDRTERAIAAMKAAAATPDPWDALAGVVRALGGHLAADRGLFDTITRGGRPNHVVPQRPEWFQAIVEPVVCRAREAGAVRDDVAATDLIALAAAISRVHPERANEPLWERYLELVLAGTRPAAAGERLPHRPARRPPRIG